MRLPAPHRVRSHAWLRDQMADRARARFGVDPPGLWDPDPQSAAETSDLAAGLIDAYALALHVLWTYQEAWAEEGFLATARLDQSADRLLDHLGYRLGTGVAASGLQHLRARAGTTAVLAAGFAVTSSANQDGSEPEAVYETTETVAINATLNEMRALDPGEGLRVVPRRPPPDSGGRPPPRSGKALGDELAARLDDERLGSAAARKAAKARQEALRLADMIRTFEKNGGQGSGCKTLKDVCAALCEAQKTASADLDPADRRPGALTDSQELLARQLRLLAERQSGVMAQLEKALARPAGESDAVYSQRLGAMVAFLDGLVAGLVQDARDQVALARGQDALLRLDRAYGAPGTSRLGRIPPGTDSLFLLSSAVPETSRPLEAVRAGDYLVLAEDVVSVDDSGVETRQRLYREAARIARVRQQPPQGGTQPLTRVFFNQPLRRGYDLDRVVVLGNIAPITQGATVEEVGVPSPDGVTITLGQRPLTWVRDPSAPGGHHPEISVKVNGHPWRRVTDLLASGPHDPVYAVEQVAGGGTRLRFGNGREGGAALPPEAEIVLLYRIGLGASGSRGSRRVDAARRAHPAVEETFNPLPIEGGADPEPRALARQRGPLITSAMDRAASASDVRALALAFDGVARARVFTEGTARRARLLVIVSGPRGEAPDATLLHDLRVHLAARVPPGVEIVTEPRRQLLVFARILLRIKRHADPLTVARRVRARLGVERDPDAPPGLLDPERVDLDDDLRLSQVYGALEGTPGLVSTVVQRLYREDTRPDLHDRIQTGPRELLTWAGASAGERANGRRDEGVEILHEEAVDL